jgi:hypothetical protein
MYEDNHHGSWSLYFVVCNIVLAMLLLLPQTFDRIDLLFVDFFIYVK